MPSKINAGVRRDASKTALTAAVFVIAGAVIVSTVVAGAGCSDNAGGGGGTGGAGNIGGAPSLPLYRPCDAATQVGGFQIKLVDAAGNSPATTTASGGVRDAADSREAWRLVVAEGSCRLMADEAFSCATACPTGEYCAGPDRCAAEPVFKSVGVIRVAATGPGANAPPFDMAPSPANNTYSHTFSDPYPPYSPGAEIILQTNGGDYGAFALTGRGIPSLRYDPVNLIVRRTEALPLAWSPPGQPAVARVRALLDVAPGLSPSSRIECDFPDTGTAEIPASLIDQLLDRGVASTPFLLLERHTVDSTTIPPGCVELAVTSAVESAVTVESGL